MTTITANGKPKLTEETRRIERQYRNVLTLFLSGQLPDFTHQRHVHVANILTHLPYGRELMHLGLQTMSYRQFVVGKYRAEITDFNWDQLDGTLPDPVAFADLPGGGTTRRPAYRFTGTSRPSMMEASMTIDSNPSPRQRVLFLCTHNSARSQMAEGLLRVLGGDRFEVFSAGTEATRVRPHAIAAMAELGIDISDQESKTLERYLGEPFDAVVTVCDDANESCPIFFGATKRLHWSFPDPSKATGTDDEQLAVYRRVRDAIRARIEAELVGVGYPSRHERQLSGNQHPVRE